MNRLLLPVLLLFLFAVSLQAGPIVWNLVDAEFDDGGTVTGHFMVDGASTLDWSLSVSGGNEGYFPEFTYTPANSTVNLYLYAGGWRISFRSHVLVS